jgi:hypothetical protein
MTLSVFGADRRHRTGPTAQDTLADALSRSWLDRRALEIDAASIAKTSTHDPTGGEGAAENDVGRHRRGRGD